MKNSRFAVKLLSALLCVIMSLSGCAGVAGGSADASAPEFTLDIPSTGKSDFILIRMDGLVIINDAADEDDYELIKDTLDSYHIKNIDYLILSHYDNDHIGSAAKLVANYKIANVYGPDYLCNSRLYWTLMGALENAGVEMTTLTQDISIGTEHGGFDINVPRRSGYDDDNNYSLITTLRYNGHSFLLTGDALKTRMSEFNASLGNIGAIDFIKLPHHGDGNKELYDFIAKYTPAYAAVTTDSADSVGEALLDALKTSKTTLLGTYGGNIRAAITGDSLSVVYTGGNA